MSFQTSETNFFVSLGRQEIVEASEIAALRLFCWSLNGGHFCHYRLYRTLLAQCRPFLSQWAYSVLDSQHCWTVTYCLTLWGPTLTFLNSHLPKVSNQRLQTGFWYLPNYGLSGKKKKKKHCGIESCPLWHSRTTRTITTISTIRAFALSHQCSH